MGHANSISYVRLSTRSVVRTYPTLRSVSAVVLGDGMLFYDYGAIPLASGVEIPDLSGTLRMTAGRLEAGGGAIVGVSAAASSLVRWTVGAAGWGEAAWSSAAGFPAACGGVWLSAGGSRIYTSCGTVFGPWAAATAYPWHVSSFDRQVIALADGLAGGRMAVVHPDANDFGAVDGSTVTVYESAYLKPAGRIRLSGFGGGVAGYGRWLMADPGGSTLYVISEAASGTVSNAFQLETIDLAAASGCLATFDSSAVGIGGGGARLTAAVTAAEGCLYRPVSETAWLTVISGEWGSGSRTIEWLARANRTGAARTGTIRMGGQTLTVTQAADTLPTAAIPLAIAVTASAYSRELDRLVAVVTEPAEVDILDPLTGAAVVVPLPAAPRGLALLPGGLTAAVAHDGWVSYVDLAAGTVSRTIETRTDAGAVAAAPNGSTYLLPSADAGTLTVVSPVAGTATRVAIGSAPYLYHSYAAARVAADGRSLWASRYAAAISRFDLTGAAPVLASDEAIADCFGFWLSEDGERMATRCGVIYRVAPGAAAELDNPFFYAGAAQIDGADHLLSRYATAVVTPSVSPGEVQIYGDSNANLIGRIPLPVMTSAGGTAQTTGRAVYWSAGGARLVALVAHTPAAGGATHYGLFPVTPNGSATGCNLGLSPAAVSVSFSASAGELSVTAGAACVWEIRSSADWLTVTGGSLGAGSATVSYAVTANPTLAARTATLTAGGATLTVTQAAGRVAVNPSSVSVPIGGVSGATFGVSTSSLGLGWTAVASAPWITLSGGASGTGPGTVTYSVAVNPGPGARTGTITVGGTAVFTVNQTNVYGPPEISTLPPPVASGPVFVWSEVAGAPAAYRLMVASSAGVFPSATTSTECAACVINVEVTGTSYEAPAGLLTAGATYFWLVNARNGELAGAWSAIGELAVLPSGTLPTVVYRQPDGGMVANRLGESALRPAGGVLAGDPAIAYDASTGAHWVAARDSYSGLWLNSISADGEWSGWRALGGIVLGTPAIAVTADGAVHVAARDHFDSYWIVRVVNGSGTWAHLAGVFATDPALAPAADNSVRIVGRDRWGGMWGGRRSAAGVFSGWSFGGGITVGRPSIAVGNDGLGYVAARDASNTVWLNTLNDAGQWGGWLSTNGVAGVDPQMLAPVTGGPLTIAILDPTGASWTRSFFEGPSAWGAWTSYGGILVSMAATQTAGGVAVAGFDGEGNLWWNSGGNWTSLLRPGPGNSPVAAGPR